MKKLLIAVLVAISSLGVASCNADQSKETENSNNSESEKAEWKRDFTYVHIGTYPNVLHDEVTYYSFRLDGGIIELCTKNHGWIRGNSNIYFYSTEICPLCKE